MSTAALTSLSNITNRGFRQRKPGWIGIDIGTGSIKLAQVQQTASGWKLLSHRRIPMSVNTHEASETEEEDSSLVPAVVNALKQEPALFSLFSGRKAACLLPMSNVDYQSLKLPEGSAAELHSMIQQELEQQNGSEPKEFVFWRDNFGRDLEEGMTQTSVISAPQADVLAISKYLLRSACDCEVMDVLPFALSRAVTMTMGNSATESVAAFEWGTSTPLLTIIKDGVPIFSRVFRNCGFSKLTQLLQDGMGLNLQESLHMLKVYRSPETQVSVEMNSMCHAIADKIISPLKQLSKEFEKTFDYIKQQRRDLIPQQVCLFGTGTALCDVENVIAEMTGIPATVWALPSLTGEAEQSQKLLHAQLGAAISLSALAYEI